MFDFKTVSFDAEGDGGYRSLAQRIEPHLGKRSLVGFAPVLAVVHISDLHICDAQSPARLPLTNRFGDPHHPLFHLVNGPVGNYRPQEMLSTQVVQAMLSTINKVGRGPFSKRELDCVIMTGDLTDNAQKNEFSWLIHLLEAGTVVPNSGGPGYQGPGGDIYDVNFWNPHGTPPGEKDDHARERYGFPTIDQLLSAAVDSFTSEGLHLQTIPVHGNHDLLLQGTVPPNSELRALLTGSARAIEVEDELGVLQAAEHFKPTGPVSWPSGGLFGYGSTTADKSREHIGEAQWIHNQREKYFTSELNGVVFISLDTVNKHGGWDGSISITQFNWLHWRLQESEKSPVIILSHHPLDSLGNTYSPVGGEPRVGADRIKQLLVSHPNVIAWLAGHSHRNRIVQVGGERGFWHIETCSLIDWPQEARLIELFRSGDEYVVVTTMFAHSSPVQATENKRPAKSLRLGNPKDLAGLSRELAANDWQRRGPRGSVLELQGGQEDRNVFLHVCREARE